MGTYTANYNLFLPSIGEQGWGELVNGNFTTIDTAMVGLNTRIATLKTETDTMKEKLDKIVIDSNGTIIGNLNGKIIPTSIKPYSISTSLTVTLSTNQPLVVYAGGVPCSGSITISATSGARYGSASLLIITTNNVISNALTTSNQTFAFTNACIIQAMNTWMAANNGHSSGTVTYTVSYT